MHLAAGSRLGPYEIVAPLGAGGMGEVYRALDTRLNRTVAVKIANDKFTARFQREAQAIASLNHPNICQLYDVGPDYLVMEFVEGSRLAPVADPAELLDLAVQIADGLSAAHAAGIVHRDLKPDNILVTADRRVKILDFGLAKVAQAATAAGDATQTLELTRPGTVLGTVDYMSPEQARGEPDLTAQSDQFSLGLVLYELASGKRPFHRPSAAETMAAIIRETAEPLPETVPAPLRWVTERLLAKEPGERYDSTRDVYRELKRLREGHTQTTSVAPKRGGISRPVLWLAVLAAAAVIGAAWMIWRRPAENTGERTVRFTITPKQLLRGGDGQIDAEVSVSPDGKHIAYVESQGGQLWVRDIDTEEAHPVPGTTRVYQAFWSPDARHIGYATGVGCGARPCDLVQIPIEGGTPTPIVKLPGPFRRASWSSDGETILYGAAPLGLFTIPARGGTPTQVIAHPHIEHPSWLDLPGGRRAYLYQTGDPKGRPPLPHSVWIQVAGEKDARLVVKTTSTNPYPAYSMSGHIIYVDGLGEETAIWALPYSLAKLQATGKAFPIAPHGASPMVSRTDTLVYSDVPTSRWQMKWVDRSGATLSNIGEPQRQEGPVLSPDGRKVVVMGMDLSGGLWLYQVDTGMRTRLAADTIAGPFYAWTPAGNAIAYAAARSGNSDLLWKGTDGEGEAKVLAATAADEEDPAWSPDGKFLMYAAAERGGKTQLPYRERRADGVGEPVVFLKGEFNHRMPRFSPDGRFVAYASDESGRFEIYVREFPSGANEQRISANGGALPRWSRNGSEIFFVGGRRLFAVSVQKGRTFSAKAPEALFDFKALPTTYDVAADGKRFVVLDKPGDEGPLAIHVVHNWFAEWRGKEK